VRTFQVILVDNVVNTFAFVLTYMFRLCIVKLFIMLNSEVLSLNFLLEFLSLDVALSRFGEAVLDLARVVRVSEWVCTCTAI
jgi:hypothetical protein